MKKPAKPKTKTRKPSGQSPPAPPPPPPIEQATTPRWHRRVLQRAERVLAILGLFATPLAVILYWGPPWPTSPVFVPGYPSSGGPYSALDVPFAVTNKSVLFPIKNLGIRCVLQPVRLTTLTIKDIAVALPNKYKLRPLEAASYTCPFTEAFHLHIPDDRIVEAHIVFETDYEIRLLWWTLKMKGAPADFTLNTSTIPPQWTPGKRLH